VAVVPDPDMTPAAVIVHEGGAENRVAGAVLTVQTLSEVPKPVPEITTVVPPELGP
jgi:hypothetical protein